MVKVKVGDKAAFSNAILKLLENQKMSNKLADDAQKDVYHNWSWDARAKDFANFLNSD